MEKPIDTGGPAFPYIIPAPGFQHIESGMTLRDWFAGQAISGWTSNNFATDNGAAERAYKMADAMIAALTATHGEEGK